MLMNFKCVNPFYTDLVKVGYHARLVAISGMYSYKIIISYQCHNVNVAIPGKDDAVIDLLMIIHV